MEFIQEVSAKLLEFGESIGGIAVAAPLAIVAAIVLILFARFSYKLFKIVLPLLTGIIAAIAGSEYLASIIEANFPTVKDQINPVLLSIVAIAVAVTFICFIFRKLPTIVLGVSISYLTIPTYIFPAMRKIEFVAEVLVNLDMETAVLFATVIGFIITAIAILILYKLLNHIYVLVTSVAVSVVALAVPAIFLFASFPFAATATFAAIVIGAMIGLLFSYQQLLTVRN